MPIQNRQELLANAVKHRNTAWSTYHSSRENLKKIEAVNAKIDTDVMPKIATLQTELYNNKQDTHKLVDEHIAELKKEIDELKLQIKALEAGNKK